MGAVYLGDLHVEVVVRPAPLSSNFTLLEVTARNGGGRSEGLDLRDVLVLDGEGLALRRLEPHEAANMVLRGMKDVPTYPPKWEVRAEGDRLVVEEARPSSEAEAFAEGFARGFTESGARYQVSKADEVYDMGLSSVTEVPPGAGVRGWAYYLGRPDTVQVRVAGKSVELARTTRDR